MVPNKSNSSLAPRINRRSFIATTAGSAATLLAGCLAGGSPESPANSSHGGHNGESDSGSTVSELPTTGTPETVWLNDQGDESVLYTLPARHVLVGEEAATGPLELPQVWAWAADDLDPSVPGPLYRVTEGTEFEIHFENSKDVRPHTLHVHAIGKGWIDDGAPTTTGHRIDPGDSHTYRFTADVTGTHLYHCHFDTHNHLDMGMYGILRVDPEEDENPPDREYFLTLRDWDTRLHRSLAGEDISFSQRDRNPDRFTINGRCAPYTFHPEHGSPLLVSEGDRVRVHLVNAGYEAHPFHTHNHRFEIVEKDGGQIPEAARVEQDVVYVAPAERYTIEFDATAEPGLYPAHCHKVHHVMNDEVYPGGMATAIVYEEALDSIQFEDVMALAGHHMH